MALIVATFLWGDKYGPEYVQRLQAGVSRNLTAPHEFKVIRCDDDPLIKEPGCFARLRLFDPKWAKAQGFEIGDRVLVLDLDLIITGSIDHLFQGAEPFRILQGVNSSNPCPYNGSVWCIDIGYRPDVWSDFSIEAAAQVPYDSFPDDQAWFAAMMPNAGAFGPDDGVYAFCKPGWNTGTGLPRNARVVAFPGWRDPVGFEHLDWVKEHWLNFARGGLVGPGAYIVGDRR